MIHILRAYRDLDRSILLLIAAEFFAQIINAAFFLLINYYLQKAGYKDYTIAEYVLYRFLSVMVFAFPLGLFIRGRRLKPFFIIGSICAPIFALLVIASVEMSFDTGIIFGMMGWGAAFTMLQIGGVPYILLNSPKEQHSEGIALYYLTFSSSIVVAGGVNFLLNTFFPDMFAERELLLLFSLIGFAGMFFLFRLPSSENVSEKSASSTILGDYDWPLIIKAIVPTVIIAVGAGFTIPFINLFFYKVHGIDSDVFSLFGSITFFLVMLGVLVIPTIKRNYGYRIAITLIQSFSVGALILLATTEFFAGAVWAATAAAFFYIIRQPLMNVAGPMTTELSMYYVGSRNRELVSALSSSIWSGSWVISAKLFSVLREQGLDYVYIFYITAILYIIGIIFYYFLILAYEKRKALGLTDE